MAREARIYISPMVVATSERIFDGEKWLVIPLPQPEYLSVPASIIRAEHMSGWRCRQRMLGGKGPTLAVVEADVDQLEIIEHDARVTRVLLGQTSKTKDDAWAMLDKVDAGLCGLIRAAIAQTGSNLKDGLSSETNPSRMLTEQPKEWARARRAHEDPTPTTEIHS